MNNNTEDYQSFLNTIRKVKGPKIHKINNSLGVYDAYKYYRKNKPKDKKYILSESQFFKIIREINKLQASKILKGEQVKLPHRMGYIELRKFYPTVTLDPISNKIKTTYPIDWNNTLKLWYEDEEAKNNKTLIRLKESEVYKVHYNKTAATYTNKTFYEFKINRSIKRALKDIIKKGKVDAFILNKNYHGNKIY